MVRLVKCPHCGSEVDKPFKTWDVKPKRGGSFKVSMYACSNCGKKFKIAEKL